MGILDRFLPKRQLTTDQVEEAIQAFADKGKSGISDDLLMATRGEGLGELQLADAFGATSLGSFNLFYNKYINKAYANEVAKINEYRRMAKMPEVADVVEDAVNESTQEEADERKLIKLEILDKELANNKNIVKNIQDEFDKLFYDRIDIASKIRDMMRTYYVDGRVYYERVINRLKPSDGIVSIKKLPTLTMDYAYDRKTGKKTAYYQYLAPRTRMPLNKEEAAKDNKVIVFEPEQIGIITSGIYGFNRKDVIGYLDNSRIPYNQLNLLETSLVIYRIVRAPERYVFKIDTGNMPKDKALKFVEKIKTKFYKKQTYNPETGRLTQEPNVMSILENFWLPQSADGRGSDVDTVGGNPAGFAEMDDIYYFARKLYRALKYPMSRVTASQEKREAEVLFGGTSVGEISRDEIKWSKFLEKQQYQFCKEFRDLFLLHLQFRGMKKEYNISKSKINIIMQSPSHYREQMEQSFLAQRFDNYNTLAGNEEMSKSYLMKKFLKWDETEIKENADGLKKDVKLGFKEGEEDEKEFGGGFGGGGGSPFGKQEKPKPEEEKPKPEEEGEGKAKEKEEEKLKKASA